MDNFQTAIGRYKGTPKRFLQSIALDLGIDAIEPKTNSKGEVTGDRELTVEQLKEKILDTIDEETLIIIPRAQRLPQSIRYWIEQVMNDVDAIVVAIVNNHPNKEPFIEMLEIKLDLPSNKRIRKIIKDEADRLKVKFSENEIAELMTYVGRNPMLARKAVRQKASGLQNETEHRQYIVTAPILFAGLMAFGLIKYVGLASGDRTLYIIGGASMIIVATMRQLGRVSGAKKNI